MEDFIEQFLSELQESITNKVDGQFNDLKSRIERIDQNLSNIEREIDVQIGEVHESIDVKTSQIGFELKNANNLLVNT